MKKYFLTLCLIILPLLSYAENFSGWIAPTVYPVDGALFCSYFISPTTGWVGGEKGIIIRTDDGGDTWEMQDSGTMEDMRGIYFTNETRGWAIGRYGTMLSTTDGGKKWKFHNQTKLPVKNIQFFSEKEWLIGGLGIHHTTDGGKTWKPLQFSPSMPSEPAINSMFFISPRVGWFLMGDTVYRTTDGGKTWQESRLPIPQNPHLTFEGNFGGIFFLSAQKGWAVLSTKLLCRTTDGGKKWEIVKILDSDTYLNSVIFFDENNGCVEYHGKVRCTEDGGKTFSEKVDGWNAVFSFNTYVFGNKQIAWTLGGGGQIAKTEDFGKTWQMKSLDNYSSFPGFIGAKNGYYFPENRIEGTRDGGKTRKKLYTSSFTRKHKDINTINPGRFFLNQKVGWVGWVEMKTDKQKELPHSLILHTNDGGDTWSVQYNEPGRKVNDIFFINEKVGWAVGSEGLVLNTTDAGKTWERQKINMKGNLLFLKVFFADNKQGWLLGEQKKMEDKGSIWSDSPSGGQSFILHTIDGGITWKQLSKIRDNLLNEIIYLNDNNMWINAEIMGDTENIVSLLHSKDGGKTWKQTLFNEINYGILFFNDEKNGVLLGNKGLMYVTTDGGKKWNMKKQGIHKEPWNINTFFTK